MPVPPKTKAWLPAALAFASMPERSMRSPPATPTPSKAATPTPPRMMSRAPGRGVGDGVEVEDVVAEAAEQVVGAAAAAQHVVAGLAVERCRTRRRRSAGRCRRRRSRLSLPAPPESVLACVVADQRLSSKAEPVRFSTPK